MIRNKKIVIVLMVISIACLAVFGFSHFINEKNQQEEVDKNTVTKVETHKENEQKVQTFEEANMQEEDINTNKEKNPFYFIYMVQNDGTPETSFISKTLNPSYRYDSEVNTSVAFDDNGKVIEDDKMILIKNYKLSEENKQKIKSIAGEKNYEKAIKEIKERVKETKETNFN